MLTVLTAFMMTTTSMTPSKMMVAKLMATILRVRTGDYGSGYH